MTGPPSAESPAPAAPDGPAGNTDLADRVIRAGRPATARSTGTTLASARPVTAEPAIAVRPVDPPRTAPSERVQPGRSGEPASGEPRPRPAAVRDAWVPGDAATTEPSRARVDRPAPAAAPREAVMADPSRPQVSRESVQHGPVPSASAPHRGETGEAPTAQVQSPDNLRPAEPDRAAPPPTATTAADVAARQRQEHAGAPVRAGDSPAATIATERGAGHEPAAMGPFVTVRPVMTGDGGADAAPRPAASPPAGGAATASAPAAEPGDPFAGADEGHGEEASRRALDAARSALGVASREGVRARRVRDAGSDSAVAAGSVSGSGGASLASAAQAQGPLARPAVSSAIVEQVTAALARLEASGGSVRVRLDPPALGEIAVRFVRRGEQLRVEVVASRTDVATALSRELHRLDAALARHGEPVQVDVSGGSQQDARAGGGAGQREAGSAGADPRGSGGTAGRGGMPAPAADPPGRRPLPNAAPGRLDILT
jgi:hypothetical protein